MLTVSYRLLLHLLEIPALLVLGIWFVFSLWSAALVAHAAAGGGVAFFAHIGGFAFGLAHGPPDDEATAVGANVVTGYRLGCR